MLGVTGVETALDAVSTHASTPLLAPPVLPLGLDKEPHLSLPPFVVNHSVEPIPDATRQQLNPTALTEFLPLLIHHVNRVAVLNVLEDNQIVFEQCPEVPPESTSSNNDLSGVQGFEEVISGSRRILLLWRRLPPTK